MNKKSYLTAITRKRPSKPMRRLEEIGLLRAPMLDYGSGKGFDACYYQTATYDPHYFPYKPKGKFDTIVCNYVLCTVKRAEEKKILKDIQSLLTENGAAYISVRRDIKGQHFRKNGTYQRRCELDLPLVYQDSQYAIYILERSHKV